MKISDPYYKPLFEKYGMDFIIQAGYFESAEVNYEESLKILCTPINHIKQPTTNKHCILVSTGAMCPIHDGHIEMLINAKDKLEDEGYEVLGGYIAPDHISHIHHKGITKNALSTAERNLLVSKKIWEHKLEDWLSLDPWLGTFNSLDLNFTVEMYRLELYIKQYLGIETEFCYVCGSDRFEFSNTFIEKGLCCVVDRPMWPGIIENNPRLFYVEGYSWESSTAIREEMEYEVSKSDVKVRIDETPTFPYYKEYFSRVEFVDIKEQRQKFFDVEFKSTNDIISLDPLICNNYYLQVSREFDLFGHMKLGYYTNEHNLPEPGIFNCTLYDDDIYTGGTMKFASDYLKKEHDIIIDHFFSFNISQGEEILDNRDFVIFDNAYNGLVIKMNDEHFRVPYVYPFVDPRMRCSILDPLQFSIEVWKFNCTIHQYDDTILSECYQNSIFNKFFDGNTKLYDICKFYLNFLEDLK
jgi:hypothetical protein